MGKWKSSEYNANYILSKPLLVEQLKYENAARPGRLEEVCVERYEDGEACIIFTVQSSADRDRMGKIDYNSLFDDLKNKFNDPALCFTSTYDEVHTVLAKSGYERLLTEVLTRLEQYDNSLSEISRHLLAVISPEVATANDVKKARERLRKRQALLDATEKQVSGAKRRRAMTKKVGQTTKRRKVAARRKPAARRKRS